jgi:hypothetical protein
LETRVPQTHVLQPKRTKPTHQIPLRAKTRITPVKIHPCASQISADF